MSENYTRGKIRSPTATWGSVIEEKPVRHRGGTERDGRGRHGMGTKGIFTQRTFIFLAIIFHGQQNPRMANPKQRE